MVVAIQVEHVRLIAKRVPARCKARVASILDALQVLCSHSSRGGSQSTKSLTGADLRRSRDPRDRAGLLVKLLDTASYGTGIQRSDTHNVKLSLLRVVDPAAQERSLALGIQTGLETISSASKVIDDAAQALRNDVQSFSSAQKGMKEAVLSRGMAASKSLSARLAAASQGRLGIRLSSPSAVRDAASRPLEGFGALPWLSRSPASALRLRESGAGFAGGQHASLRALRPTPAASVDAARVVTEAARGAAFTRLADHGVATESAAATSAAAAMQARAAPTTLSAPRGRVFPGIRPSRFGGTCRRPAGSNSVAPASGRLCPADLVGDALSSRASTGGRATSRTGDAGYRNTGRSAVASHATHGFARPVLRYALVPRSAEPLLTAAMPSAQPQHEAAEDDDTNLEPSFRLRLIDVGLAGPGSASRSSFPLGGGGLPLGACLPAADSSHALNLLVDRMRLTGIAEAHDFVPAWNAEWDLSGRVAFTGADDGCIRVWSTRPLALQATIRDVQPGLIQTMLVSPDNTVLAAASEPMDEALARAARARKPALRELRLWDAASLRPLLAVPAHRDEIRFLECDSLFSGVFVSASKDGTIKVWDTSAKLAPAALRDAVAGRRALAGRGADTPDPEDDGDVENEGSSGGIGVASADREPLRCETCRSSSHVAAVELGEAAAYNHAIAAERAALLERQAGRDARIALAVQQGTPMEQALDAEAEAEAARLQSFAPPLPPRIACLTIQVRRLPRRRGGGGVRDAAPSQESDANGRLGKRACHRAESESDSDSPSAFDARDAHGARRRDEGFAARIGGGPLRSRPSSAAGLPAAVARLLPHQPVKRAPQLRSQPVKVCSAALHPIGGVIAAGCGDGTVRLYRTISAVQQQALSPAASLDAKNTSSNPASSSSFSCFSGATQRRGSEAAAEARLFGGSIGLHRCRAVREGVGLSGSVGEPETVDADGLTQAEAVRAVTVRRRLEAVRKEIRAVVGEWDATPTGGRSCSSSLDEVSGRIVASLAASLRVSVADCSQPPTNLRHSCSRHASASHGRVRCAHRWSVRPSRGWWSAWTWRSPRLVRDGAFPRRALGRSNPSISSVLNDTTSLLSRCAFDVASPPTRACLLASPALDQLLLAMGLRDDGHPRHDAWPAQEVFTPIAFRPGSAVVDAMNEQLHLAHQLSSAPRAVSDHAEPRKPSHLEADLPNSLPLPPSSISEEGGTGGDQSQKKIAPCAISAPATDSHISAKAAVAGEQCRFELDGSLICVLGEPTESDDPDDVDVDFTVDSVMFSPAGDALVAVCEDGKARVWRWLRDYVNPWSMQLDPWTGEHRLDKVQASQHQRTARFGPDAPLKSRNGGLGIDDAIWCSDGRLVVTVQNRDLTPRERQQRAVLDAPLVLSAIKVWCGRTGVLLRTLPRAHSGRIQAMTLHPHEDRLCASGGADGMLCVWDIEQGEKWT